MKESLQAGLEHSFSFKVDDTKLVPALFPEAVEFRVMPNVFATGYMVGLVEWACIQAVNPHLDWPAEQTVGTRVELSHEAATPPGCTVTVKVTLLAVEGRKLTFAVEARDNQDIISRGTHQRFVINKEKFDAGLKKKIGL
jgi:fluoroacetyl-CoA thioesterase